MIPTLYPGRREGQTVTFLTDLHVGKASFGDGGSGPYYLTAEQHRKCGVDLDYLSSFSSVIGLGGDLVDWGSSSPEDGEFLSFLNDRTGIEKYVVTTGNHDFASHRAPHPHRTGDQWSTSTGFPKYSHAPQGNSPRDGVQVVGLSQESMRFNEWIEPGRAAQDPRPEVKPGRGFHLSDNEAYPFDESTAFGYLRSRLETGRATWIMIHYPLAQHFPSENTPETSLKMTEVITQYPNVIGVLSGHRHANPFLDPNHVKEVEVSGLSGTVVTAGVNAPASGGAMSQAGGPSISYPWDSPFIAVTVTYSPGRVIVRWRDLIRRSWIPSVNGGYSKTLNVSCQAPIKLY